MIASDEPQPHTVLQAEAVINTVRKSYGDAGAKDVEPGSFTGCRPSQMVALEASDVDLKKATVPINNARAMGRR